MRVRFYPLIRDLHLYFGLFVSPFVLVFAISVFFLVHSWLPRIGSEASTARVVSALTLPGDLATLSGRPLIDGLKPALKIAGVRGEVGFVRHIGKSHVGDVLGAVGPPSRISATAGGFAMLYEHNNVEEKQLGFNINAPVLYLFKFVGAKAWLEHQAWLVTFDTNGVVRGWGEEHWRTSLGWGAGAQLLVTVSGLVDSSQVRRPAPQHDWGKSSLARLPKALNAAQSLDSGWMGLEQMMSPTAVGQRTLEMTPAPQKFPKKR